MPRFRIDPNDLPPDIKGWTPISLASTGEPSGDDRLAAERAITELLQCDQVIVLVGLGASLCIKDPKDAKRSLFPTMSSLWDQVSSKVGDDLLKKVQDAVGFSDGKNIEELLSRCQMKLGLEPPPSARAASPTALVPGPDIVAFVKKAEEVIRTACSPILEKSTTEAHEDFLRRLVRRGPRRPRPNLFTTNYDLCFEVAASRIGLPVIDGFTFSVPPRFQPEVFDYDIVTTSSYAKEPDFVARLLRLYKLHGSVDWHPQEAEIIKKEGTSSPILIYPRVGKYASTYSPPFLEMMSRFQGLLRQRNVGLLSVGCGFNDLHIAEPVLSAIKSNTSLRLVVSAPDLCEKDAQNLFGRIDAKGAVESNPFMQKFDHLITNGDNRITLINGFLPDLVRLMPMLNVQTDDEQHEARIKKLEWEIAKLKGGSGGAS